MAVRAFYKDEYAEKKFRYSGIRYHHIEHARWAKLWDTLGLGFEYQPRQHEIRIPGTQTYKKGKDDETVFYAPHFYLAGWDIFIDIKKEPPKESSVFCAGDLFRLTGIPVVIFQGPMFQPNWTTFSPPATFCRENSSPQNYFLQYDGRSFKIAPCMNENDVLHPRLRDAFSEAMQV